MKRCSNLRKSTFNYVYSIGAVRSRLNRGAKFVYLFLPNCGDLFKCTKKNLKIAVKTFNHAAKYGNA